jgi:membrane dipeptidase
MKQNKTPITRRDMLKGAGLATAAFVTAPAFNRGRFRLFANHPIEYSSKAIDLIGRTTVIDMLSVLTLDFNKEAKWFKDPDLFTTADLQPYIDSGINVFHQSVGMGGPSAYENALQYFAHWNGFVANDVDHFMRIDSVSDLKRVKKSGKIGIMLGLQNSEHFRRPDDVDFFACLGQRVSH